MPFMRRKIEPSNIRRHQTASNEIFEEHSDVANNALVNALLQLSSLTFHADDVFREIEIQAIFFHKRCSNVGNRIHCLQRTCETLDPKAVQIPVSDLDAEFKIPPHLHYRSCDSVEEDLFTTDSRTPCLIHLHNLAGSNFSDVFGGSQAYAKPARPKSFDPNILLQENNNYDRVLPSKSIANIASTVKTELDGPNALLPTPEKKMQLESSQHIAEIITVDTSGSQFDRRVNLRRSQRSTVAASRRKTHKERHKTLTALPGHVSCELGMHDMQRQSSLHSDLNNSTSSFIGDGSIASGDSSTYPLESYGEHRPDILPSSPVRRRLKNRHSNNANPAVRNGRIPSHQADSNVNQEAFLRDKNLTGEDRISSGFWSGTESCRHSTTSEILIQHQNVTQALQQVLSNKPPPDENRFKAFDNDTNASTVSLNSRLSVLEPSTMSSSVVSLTHTHLTDQASNPDDSMRIPRSDVATPRQLNFSTPAGAYNFMNPNFEEQPPKLPHLASPMDLLILGSRRGNDGVIRDEMESFDSSFYSDNANTSKQENTDFEKNPHLDRHSVFTPNTPQASLPQNHTPLSAQPQNQSHFFGSNFSPTDRKTNVSSPITKQPSRELDFHSELKARLEKGASEPVKRPSPPRRQSSLRSRHKEVKEILAYMEPLSKVESSESQTTVVNDANVSPINNADTVTRLSISPISDHSKQINSFDSLSPDKSAPAISSYQPSKSVASHLQTRRPATMYNYYLPANEATKRPVSIVEPFTKPVTQIPQHSVSVSDITKSDFAYSPKKPSPLCTAPPNGVIPTSPKVMVYQALHTPTTVFKPQTPKSPTDSKLPGLSTYPTNLSKPPSQQATPFVPKAPKPEPAVATTIRDVSDHPSSVSTISPSQLQAASLSLRRVPRKVDTSKEVNIHKPATCRSLETPDSTTHAALSVSDEKVQSEHIKPFSRKPQEKPAVYASLSVKQQKLSKHNDVNFVTESPKQTDQNLSNGSSLHTDASSSVSPTKKPPVAAKPTSLQSIKKPAIRPKPLLSPRPISQLDDKMKNNKDSGSQQQGTKNSDLKTKTANMRATFFAVQSSPTKKNFNENLQKTQDTMKDEVTEICVASSDEIEKKDSKAVNSEPIISNGFSESIGISPYKELVAKTDNKASLSKVTGENNAQISNTNGVLVIQDSNEVKSSPVEASGKRLEKVTPSDEGRACNGVEDHQDLVEDDYGDNTAAEDLSSSKTTNTNFKASIQKLRGSYYSTSTTTDVFGGNKSPGNPLNFDRKSTFRFSTSSLERRRKAASNTALREDFKALLLQNLSKSNTSRMSATEKLKIARQNANRPNTVSDGEDIADGPAASSRPDIVPLSDIKPSMGASRPGRRPNRMPENRKSYAGSPGYLSKKHPPISSSGRFHTRSRTPTRPMMAITEDSESEPSPEKPLEELQRSKSVGDF